MRSYHTLLSIFSIVDQKYAVEGRLRPYSEVSRWTQAEITEVLEAGRNNDPSNRREEICDFFYVAYASFLWRKKGQTTGQEFLQVLASHPSFERYMSQLSEGDWTFALTKFQERNAYLFDESFLIKLKSIDTPTLVLDEIDLYWNKIKYLEQKGYKSPAYSDYEEMLSSLQGKEDVLRAFYTNPSDVASLAYIQACIQECKLGEPFSAYILRAITILPRCIHDYVVATETFQAQWLSPLDAFVCACLTINHTEFMTPKVAAGKILLEQGLSLEPFFATFLMYSRSSEPYMLYRGLLRSGLPANTAQGMTLHFANHMNPGFPEFARKLRGYVTKDDGRKFQEYIEKGGEVEELLESLYK